MEYNTDNQDIIIENGKIIKSKGVYFTLYNNVNYENKCALCKKFQRKDWFYDNREELIQIEEWREDPGNIGILCVRICDGCAKLCEEEFIDDNNNITHEYYSFRVAFLNNIYAKYYYRYPTKMHCIGVC